MENKPVGEEPIIQTRDFGRASVVRLAYEKGGALAVGLFDEGGETIGYLSVNIPSAAHILGKGEFFAKTWSENEQLAIDALMSGVFRDTGRTSEDTLNAPIWAFR